MFYSQRRYVAPVAFPVPVVMVRGEEHTKHLHDGNTVTLHIKGLKLKLKVRPKLLLWVSLDSAVALLLALGGSKPFL
jgi:hypothetical protein